MANKNLIDAKTLTLNEILGNGKTYRVPKFQKRLQNLKILFYFFKFACGRMNFYVYNSIYTFVSKKNFYMIIE
jgi:hypothetical protein